MKKLRRLVNRIIVTMLLFLACSSLWAQTPTYTCDLRNLTQVSCNVFEFDVYIKRTGSTVFKLAQFQMGIYMNSALVNGGTITVTPVAGSSTLTNPAQIPGPEKFSYDALANCITVTPVAPPGIANASVILNTGNGTKFIRIRLMNSVAWPAAAPTLSWNFSPTIGYETKMFAYTPLNTDITVQSSHTISALANNNTPFSTSMPDPVAQTVTGGGTYCGIPGATGAPVGLAASQYGYAYQLYKDGTLVPGAVVYGATGGAAISFGNRLPGVYTVTSFGCGSVAMTGSATVLAPTTPADASVSIAANPGTTVNAGTSVTFTATPVNGGALPTYQWYVNDVLIDLEVNPTYTYVPLDGDVVRVEMTIDPLECASPSFNTSNNITMIVNPYVAPPTAYNVTGGGAYCQGTTGLPVGLSNSELGVTYTLYKDAVAQVPTVPGNGSLITFGNQLAGTYTVKGTNGGGTVDMTGSAIITETPSLPVSVSIIADATNVCAGTTVNFTATPSNGGTTPVFQWHLNGAPVGTGLATYSLVPVNNDQVTVTLTSNLAGCLSGNPATSNPVTIVVSPAGPASVTIAANANPSCGSAPVTFTATPVNGGTPTYQWYLNSAPVGSNSVTYTYTPTTGDDIYVVMTSSLPCATGSPATSTDITMTVNTPVAASVSMSPSADPVCAGTSVTFTASPTNGGTPAYQWYKNTLPVGTGLATYTYVPLNGDQVYVVMTSNLACTTGSPATSGITTMTVNALPVPTITGPASVCINSTGNVYTTQAGQSAYVWDVPAGGTITAGLGTDAITVTWNTAGAQTVTVNYTNASTCTAVAATVYNVTVNPLPVPTITGPASVCINSTGNVYTTQAGMTAYTWNVSAGGTITAGGTGVSNTVTVTWNTTGPQTVSVNYTNTNSCTALAPAVYNVTVNALPVPTITGLAAVCATITGNVYTTQPGMTGYVWTVSAGGIITAGGTATSNTVTITWNTAGAQTVSVNYTNADGCTAPVPTVYNVTVNALPVPTITGPTLVCAGTTGNVYTTQVGMTNYVWTVSAGGIITAGGTTADNTVTVTWSTPGAKTVSVNYTNGTSCTAAAATIYNVTVNALPVPTLSGTTPAGVGSTQVYTTEAGMTNYVWTVSAGGTPTAGGTATSNTVTVLWNVAGAQSVSVNYNNANGCTAASATVYPVTVISIPPPAGAITGVSTVCQGAMGVPYSVAPILNATGYVWNLPTGASIATGANTNSITVNYSYTAVSGVITVYGTNTYGNGSPSPNFNVTVNAAPVPTITGNNNVCESSDYYTYTTEPGMTNYVWNISPGSGTLTWVPGSNQVVIFWNTPGAHWVSVSYTNAGGCTAAAPTVYNVTVNPIPGAAGTISGPSSVCAGATGIIFSVAAVANATSYAWTVPTGATITAGATTNSITVSFSLSATAGNVVVNAVNNCGNGTPSPAKAITINSLPSAAGAISGPNSVCQGTMGVVYSVVTIPNATGYAWTVPTGATIVSGATTNSITVDFSFTASSGAVTVVGTNSCGNGAISTYNIALEPVPAAPVITQNGNILTSSAPAGNQWYLDGTLIPGAIDQTYEAVYHGNYYATVTLNGCSSDTSNNIYVVVTGINEMKVQKVEVYPNPNNGHFTLSIITTGKEVFDLRITNNLGASVYERKGLVVDGTLNEVIELAHMPNGVYSIMLNSLNKQIVRKIVID